MDLLSPFLLEGYLGSCHEEQGNEEDNSAERCGSTEDNRVASAGLVRWEHRFYGIREVISGGEIITAVLYYATWSGNPPSQESSLGPYCTTFPCWAIFLHHLPHS